jgi:hypothetical protein
MLKLTVDSCRQDFTLKELWFVRGGQAVVKWICMELQAVYQIVEAFTKPMVCDRGNHDLQAATTSGTVRSIAIYCHVIE